MNEPLADNTIREIDPNDNDIDQDTRDACNLYQGYLQLFVFFTYLFLVSMRVMQQIGRYSAPVCVGLIYGQLALFWGFTSILVTTLQAQLNAIFFFSHLYSILCASMFQQCHSPTLQAVYCPQACSSYHLPIQLCSVSQCLMLCTSRDHQDMSQLTKRIFWKLDNADIITDQDHAKQEIYRPRMDPPIRRIMISRTRVRRRTGKQIQRVQTISVENARLKVPVRKKSVTTER